MPFERLQKLSTADYLENLIKSDEIKNYVGKNSLHYSICEREFCMRKDFAAANILCSLCETSLKIKKGQNKDWKG